MEQQETSGREHARTTTRWFQRVLPMTGLVLALVVLALVFLPSVRDEVALSTTRQPQPYVELYFTQTRPVEDARCGRAGDGRAADELRFTVVSHLEKERELAYRVTVAPVDGAERVRTGTVRVRPDETRRVRLGVPTPDAGDYTLTVRLPALDQQLRAHCSGGRP